MLSSALPSNYSVSGKRHKIKIGFISVLWLSLLMMAAAGASAQTTGWVGGYIVTNDGDTLRGELDNRDWPLTPDQVAFRPTRDTVAQSYTVTQLRAFYLQPTDELYLRLATRLDKTPHKNDNIQPSNLILWSDETVFARQVVRGLLSLAIHRDKAGKVHYLVQREAEPWQDLILLKYLSQTGQITTVTRYRQQLGTLTYTCPSLTTRLANLPFGLSALQSFVMAYNTCQTGQAGSYQQKASVSKAEWGVLAGASLSQLSISIPVSKAYFSDQPYRYMGSAQPTAGIWLNYYIDRNRRQWSVYNDVEYQRYNVTGAWSGNAAQFTGQFAYTYMKLHTGIRWQRPAPAAVKPFAMLGISNGFAIASRQSIRSELNRSYEQALFGAAGLRFGRFLGEVRYERGNGMTTDNVVLTGTQTACILFGIVL